MLDQSSHFGQRNFTCKFPYKVPLLTCWHAFRLRRLAQSLCRGSGLDLGLVTCWLACRLRRLAQSDGVLANRALIEILDLGYRDLARRPLLEILDGDIAWRSVAEIFPRGPLQRSSQETSYRDLVQRPGEETEVLLGDHLEIAWKEILLIEIPYKDLLWTSPLETLYR